MKKILILLMMVLLISVSSARTETIEAIYIDTNGIPSDNISAIMIDGHLYNLNVEGYGTFEIEYDTDSEIDFSDSDLEKLEFLIVDSIEYAIKKGDLSIDNDNILRQIDDSYEDYNSAIHAILTETIMPKKAEFDSLDNNLLNANNKVELLEIELQNEKDRSEDKDEIIKSKNTEINILVILLVLIGTAILLVVLKISGMLDRNKGVVI